MDEQDVKVILREEISEEIPPAEQISAKRPQIMRIICQVIPILLISISVTFFTSTAISMFSGIRIDKIFVTRLALGRIVGSESKVHFVSPPTNTMPNTHPRPNLLFADTEIMDLDETGKVTATPDTAVYDGLIAPGVGGSFVISVQNTSEVDAVYTIVLSEETDETLPIQYSLDNATWYNDFTTINNDAKLKNVDAYMSSEAAEITIYWRWAFEGFNNDANDTAFGVEGTDTATITVTITATQTNN